MTTHTISGATFKPDGVTPNYGVWEIGVHSDTGYAFGTDPLFGPMWIGGLRDFTTDTDGSLTVTLPAADGTQFYYRATFHAYDKKSTYGPFYFDLTTDKLWTDIMTAPSPVPITPPLVADAEAAASDAAASASDAATSASSAETAAATAVAAVAGVVPLAASNADNHDGTGTLAIAGSAFISNTDRGDGTGTILLEIP